MNKNQQVVLILAVVVVLAMVAVPPYDNGRYYLLIDEDFNAYRKDINYGRLGMQVATTLLATVGLYLAFRKTTE